MEIAEEINFVLWNKILFEINQCQNCQIQIRKVEDKRKETNKLKT